MNPVIIAILSVMAWKGDPKEYLSTRSEELYAKYGIKSIRIFGSRARGDARSDPDIDLIIETEKPYRFDLLGLIALEQEISEELGIAVDLILDEDLKPEIARRARLDAVHI